MIRAIISGVAKAVVDSVIDPVYRSVGPNSISIEISGQIAEFHNIKSLIFHDFTDDIDNERHILEMLLNDLNQDDVFFDIGANVGIYSCFSSTIIDSGQIVAFEPHPENRSVLEKNYLLNNISGFVESRALSNRNASGHLKSRGNTGHEVSSTDLKNSIQIEMVRGDDMIEQANLPNPTAVKVDVEGHEYAVLQGMEDTLSRRECNLLYVEIHEHKCDKHADIPDYLSRLGFEIQVVESSSGTRTLRCVKSGR